MKILFKAFCGMKKFKGEISLEINNAQAIDLLNGQKVKINNYVVDLVKSELRTNIDCWDAFGEKGKSYLYVLALSQKHTIEKIEKNGFSYQKAVFENGTSIVFDADIVAKLPTLSAQKIAEGREYIQNKATSEEVGVWGSGNY